MIFTFLSILPSYMIYFFIKKNRKILKNKDLEIQELNNLFKIDKEKYLLDKISREDELKNDFNSSIEIINNKIKEYQINSHNLKKAIEIFESKSLTFFEAKFIPFKSLNKARVGSIIRVHKYSKKLETASKPTTSSIYEIYFESETEFAELIYSDGKIDVVDDISSFFVNNRFFALHFMLRKVFYFNWIKSS